MLSSSSSTSLSPPSTTLEEIRSRGQRDREDIQQIKALVGDNIPHVLEMLQSLPARIRHDDPPFLFCGANGKSSVPLLRVPLSVRFVLQVRLLFNDAVIGISRRNDVLGFHDSHKL